MEPKRRRLTSRQPLSRQQALATPVNAAPSLRGASTETGLASSLPRRNLPPFSALSADIIVSKILPHCVILMVYNHRRRMNRSGHVRCPCLFNRSFATPFGYKILLGEDFGDYSSRLSFGARWEKAMEWVSGLQRRSTPENGFYEVRPVSFFGRFVRDVLRHPWNIFQSLVGDFVCLVPNHHRSATRALRQFYPNVIFKRFSYFEMDTSWWHLNRLCVPVNVIKVCGPHRDIPGYSLQDVSTKKFITKVILEKVLSVAQLSRLELFGALDEGAIETEGLELELENDTSCTSSAFELRSLYLSTNKQNMVLGTSLFEHYPIRVLEINSPNENQVSNLLPNSILCLTSRGVNLDIWSNQFESLTELTLEVPGRLNGRNRRLPGETTTGVLPMLEVLRISRLVWKKDVPKLRSLNARFSRFEFVEFPASLSNIHLVDCDALTNELVFAECQLNDFCFIHRSSSSEEPVWNLQQFKFGSVESLSFKVGSAFAKTLTTDLMRSMPTVRSIRFESFGDDLPPRDFFSTGRFVNATRLEIGMGYPRETRLKKGENLTHFQLDLPIVTHLQINADSPLLETILIVANDGSCALPSLRYVECLVEIDAIANQFVSYESVRIEDSLADFFCAQETTRGSLPEAETETDVGYRTDLESVTLVAITSRAMCASPGPVTLVEWNVGERGAKRNSGYWCWADDASSDTAVRDQERGTQDCIRCERIFQIKEGNSSSAWNRMIRGVRRCDLLH